MSKNGRLFSKAEEMHHALMATTWPACLLPRNPSLARHIFPQRQCAHRPPLLPERHMSGAFPIPSLTPDLLPLQAIKKERTGKVRSSFSVGAIKGSVLQDQFPYSPDDIRCPQAHQLAQLGLGTVFHEGIADTQTADALAAQQTVIGPAFQHGRGKTAC